MRALALVVSTSLLLCACAEPKYDSYACDGCGAEFSEEERVDDDGDGYDIVEDCDDQDPDVSPSAEETCDGEDDDCDGDVDEGC